MYSDEFEQLFMQVRHAIEQPRLPSLPLTNVATSLNSRMPLVTVLNYLKNNYAFKEAQWRLGISKSQLSRDVNHILPILLSYFNEINWPQQPPQQHLYIPASGAIHCTTHPRNRYYNIIHYICIY